jgi:hypothetical protein
MSFWEQLAIFLCGFATGTTLTSFAWTSSTRWLRSR